MANKILLKRSSVANKVPSVTDLTLGELAVNTYDGKLYLKKNVGGMESVITIGSMDDIVTAGTATKVTYNAKGLITSGTNISTSDVVGLATVASTGSYNDLSNKPTIPTQTSQLTNNSGYITSSGAPVQSVFGRTGTVTLLSNDITTALGFTPLDQSKVGSASGVATLDASGKIPAGQLPAIAITDTFVVNSQANMLALAAQTGDVAVRTDLNKSFILKGTSASTLSDWQELLTPTDSVTSVAGRTGAVTLTTSDIVGIAVVASTGSYADLINKPTIPSATSQLTNDSGFLTSLNDIDGGSY